MDAKAKYRSIKKAQLIILIPIVIGVIGMTVFGVLNIPTASGLFATVALVCGFVEILLAASRKRLSRNTGDSKSSHSKHESNNSGPFYHETNTNKNVNVDDLPENVSIREKIWKFDSFVRDYFRQLPLDDISFSENEIRELKRQVNTNAYLDKDLLKPIIDKMLRHLNQTFNYASIEVRRVEPGQVQQAGHIDTWSHRIVVNYDGKMGYKNVLALIAHEMSHAFQFYEFSKYPGETNEIEEFTDFLTFYLGFGPLMDKGYDYTYFDDNDHHERKVRIGYLNDYALAFAKTTMNGRRTMKEMSLKEDEEIKVIRNKVKQTHGMIPEYLTLISSFIDNLTHCQSISAEDLTDIGRKAGEYQSFSISSTDDIVNRTINENRVVELRNILKEMNDKAKQVFDLYIFFNQMNDKYVNL